MLFRCFTVTFVKITFFYDLIINVACKTPFSLFTAAQKLMAERLISFSHQFFKSTSSVYRFFDIGDLNAMLQHIQQAAARFCDLGMKLKIPNK